MKNIIKLITTILLFPLILISCSKDDCEVNLETRQDYLVDKISKFERFHKFH